MYLHINTHIEALRIKNRGAPDWVSAIFPLSKRIFQIENDTAAITLRGSDGP